MIWGILLGVWFVAIGGYSVYFAADMKKTGTLKAGWVVSKGIQLKEDSDVPAFIRKVDKHTKIFAVVSIVAGALIVVGETIKVHSITVVCLVILLCFFIWYSTVVRKAEKKYLLEDKKLKK